MFVLSIVTVMLYSVTQARSWCAPRATRASPTRVPTTHTSRHTPRAAGPTPVTCAAKPSPGNSRGFF